MFMGALSELIRTMYPAISIFIRALIVAVITTSPTFEGIDFTGFPMVLLFTIWILYPIATYLRNMEFIAERSSMRRRGPGGFNN